MEENSKNTRESNRALSLAALLFAVASFLCLWLSMANAPISAGYVVSAIIAGLLFITIILYCFKRYPHWIMLSLIPEVLGHSTAKNFLLDETYKQHLLWYFVQWWTIQFFMVSIVVLAFIMIKAVSPFKITKGAK